MSIHFAASNPFRPLEWRWRRAMAIEEGRGPRTTRRLDTVLGYKWIRQAVRFLREHAACRTDADQAALAARRPALFWAHVLWRDASARRHSVEAHLLARETDAEIGWWCGLPPDVVEAYEAVFYNVREKIQHRQYIYQSVFGETLRRAITDDFILWKLYAYMRGPHFLTALETGFTGSSWCSTADAVGDAILDDAIGTLKLKAAIAAKTVPVNASTQLALLEQFAKFVEIERTTDSAGKAESQLMNHIQALLVNMPINAAGFDPQTGKRLPPTPLSEYDVAAMELTYQEAVHVAVGKGIPNRRLITETTFQGVADANPAPAIVNIGEGPVP